MVKPTQQDMAARLETPGFEHDGASAATAASGDPGADTLMAVTLDELRPYENNPRVTRNPAWEDIKASIRERGLDAPPAITRRPGQGHYIILSGGNTRLAILRELWSETKDERFFRIPCLFRPWPERGEIVALTGHLAENELRAALSFIERALGMEKARELYEHESGQALSQAELARRLSADGCPVQQSHISSMQDAVRHLLPAIPAVLYGGLGLRQVERLAVLRKAGERIWQRRAQGQQLPVDFAALFLETLSQFDMPPDGFSLQRVQDELVGQMAGLLDADYDTLSLEMDDSEIRQQALTSEPLPVIAERPAGPSADMAAPQRSPAAQAGTAQTPRAQLGLVQARPAQTGPVQTPRTNPDPTQTLQPQPEITKSIDGQNAPVSTAPAQPEPAAHSDEPGSRQREEFLQAHIVSPAPTTERLQSVRRLIAEQMGEPLPDFEQDVLRAIPVQAGGLYPITDVWYIDPGLDEPDRLRAHIEQFAIEIAGEAELDEHIQPRGNGIGFVCTADSEGSQDSAVHSLAPFARAVRSLLQALSAAPASSGAAPDNTRLSEDLAPLLLGRGGAVRRLSDTALVKLFRLLRLARRLIDLETRVAPADSARGANGI